MLTSDTPFLFWFQKAELFSIILASFLLHGQALAITSLRCLYPSNRSKPEEKCLYLNFQGKIPVLLRSVSNIPLSSIDRDLNFPSFQEDLDLYLDFGVGDYLHSGSLVS